MEPWDDQTAKLEINPAGAWWDTYDDDQISELVVMETMG